MGFSINNLLNEATLSQQKKADIKKINYMKLFANENNFFSMNDIETLANDIEDNGLLQNLVAKENGSDTYTIVVGHRRHAAIRLLVVERGLRKFEEINCLVISKDEDELLTEYKLITSNLTHRGGFTALDTRDKLKTVERLTEIFQEFKGRGYNLKGKLRELVSDVLEISSFQTQKYQTIVKHSDEETLEAIRKNEVGIDDAYSLIQERGQVTCPPDEVWYQRGGKSLAPTQELQYWRENFRLSLEIKTGAVVKITNNKVSISFKDDEELRKIAQALGIATW